MLAVALFFAVAVLSGYSAAGSQKPLVVVSILPQAEFVTRIAGDAVKVMVLVGPGASPHSYEPTPRQMADLSTARLWFTIGVDFEHGLVPKVSRLYPSLSLVDTTRDIVYRPLGAHEHDEAMEEAEAHEDEHDETLDPHVWLGQEAVKAQLGAMLEALAALVPADAPAFRKNHADFIAEIDLVFAGLRKDLAPLAGRRVFVFHPSFGYFFDSFGIVQEAVEVGGKEPTQKALAELIDRARAERASVIFVQKQFSTTAARTVAQAIGGSVVEIDPLAPEWLKNIKTMGFALRRALPR